MTPHIEQRAAPTAPFPVRQQDARQKAQLQQMLIEIAQSIRSISATKSSDDMMTMMMMMMMMMSPDPNRLPALAGAIQALASKLSDTQAQQTLGSVLQQFGRRASRTACWLWQAP